MTRTDGGCHVLTVVATNVTYTKNSGVDHVIDDDRRRRPKSLGHSRHNSSTTNMAALIAQRSCGLAQRCA